VPQRGARYLFFSDLTAKLKVKKWNHKDEM
jgi:hypothetical protein